MIVLRIIGILLILFGLLACITIIGFIPGLLMMLVGAVLVFVGRKPRAIVVHVNNGSPSNP